MQAWTRVDAVDVPAKLTLCRTLVAVTGILDVPRDFLEEAAEVSRSLHLRYDLLGRRHAIRLENPFLAGLGNVAASFDGGSRSGDEEGEQEGEGEGEGEGEDCEGEGEKSEREGGESESEGEGSEREGDAASVSLGDQTDVLHLPVHSFR